MVPRESRGGSDASGTLSRSECNLRDYFASRRPVMEGLTQSFNAPVGQVAASQALCLCPTLDEVTADRGADLAQHSRAQVSTSAQP